MEHSQKAASDVPEWYANESASEITKVATALELHQQRGRVTTHVMEYLIGESDEISPVVVINNSAWFVSTNPTLGEYAVPILGVA